MSASPKIGLNLFKTLRFCANEYQTKLHEAVIKKFNLKLNKQFMQSDILLGIN